VRRELESMHLGEFVGAAGRVVQRTETTRRQREVFKALDIAEPPLVHDVDTLAQPRRRAKRPALALRVCDPRRVAPGQRPSPAAACPGTVELGSLVALGWRPNAPGGRGG